MSIRMNIRSFNAVVFFVSVLQYWQGVTSSVLPPNYLICPRYSKERSQPDTGTFTDQ